MMRETLKSFGAVEDTLVYESALGETRSVACWSKTEDNIIEEAYSGAMEVLEGDKANSGITSVSETSNVSEYEEKSDEKLYSEEDMKNAEDLF